MKVPNEVKVGLLTLIALAFAYGGYKYVQGRNLLSRAQFFHAIYDSAAGVTVGTPVRMAGVPVGAVSGIALDQENLKVRIDFNIEPEYDIPPTTVATIATVSLLGEVAVDLSYKESCGDTVACLESGSQIQGRSLSLVQSFLGGSEDGPSVEDRLNGVVDELNATLFGENSDHPIARASHDLAASMANLNLGTERLNAVLANNAAPLNATLRNLSSLSNQLAAKQADIAHIIDNTQGFTNELSELQLQQTLSSTRDLLDSFKVTLATANRSISGVDGMMVAIQNGEGTLGRLIYDPEMADRIDRASASLDTLLTDFAERPYRYVPFKSRNRVLRFDRKDERNRSDEVMMIEGSNDN